MAAKKHGGGHGGHHGHGHARPRGFRGGRTVFVDEGPVIIEQGVWPCTHPEADRVSLLDNETRRPVWWCSRCGALWRGGVWRRPSGV